jgi:hypothetical protein
MSRRGSPLLHWLVFAFRMGYSPDCQAAFPELLTSEMSILLSSSGCSPDSSRESLEGMTAMEHQVHAYKPNNPNGPN